MTHLFQYENQDRIKEFLRERICDDFELGFKNVSPKIRVQISPDVEARLRQNSPTNLSSGKARDRIRREDRLGRKLVTRGLSLCFDLTPFCHIFIMIVKVRSKGVPPLTICHKEDIVTGLWLTRG